MKNIYKKICKHISIMTKALLMKSSRKVKSWNRPEYTSILELSDTNYLKIMLYYIQRNVFFLNFQFLKIFWNLFLAVLGLCCCAWAFSSCSERGLLFVAVCRLLIVMASLVAEHRLQVRRLRSCGSRALERRLSSCFVACGIFLDQGSNPCPLHWQADS